MIVRLKYAAFICAGLMLSACDGGASATLPEGVSAADVATFKAAVIAADCSVSFETADETKAQIGFDDDKLRSIVQYLTLAGESEPTDSGFRLTTGPCANA